MFRVFANDADNTLAVDDLALVADLFYGCSYFHEISFQFPVVSFQTTKSFVAIHDAATVQVIG